MTRPAVVDDATWRAELNALLDEEKRLTREHDALAARRRRLPMVRIPGPYDFVGANGPADLGTLFDGRRQLIVYHFMFPAGSLHQCEGCSMFVDNLGHLAHLHARETSFALVSSAPYEELEPVRRRMGWTVPWYSSSGTTFGEDMGVTSPDGEMFGISVFLSDGGEVFRTYATSGRGVETLGTNWTLLDLTPLGRQETWEDSPEGWPQEPPYSWWRLHDEYSA